MRLRASYVLQEARSDIIVAAPEEAPVQEQGTGTERVCCEQRALRALGVGTMDSLCLACGPNASGCSFNAGVWSTVCAKEAAAASHSCG